jgi:hypothetical protein
VATGSLFLPRNGAVGLVIGEAHMSEGFCLPFTQKCVRGRFLFLLVAILLTLFLGPLLGGFVKLRLLLNISITAILITAVYAVGRKGRHLVIAGALALPMVTSMWALQFWSSEWSGPPTFINVMGLFSGVLFITFTVCTILSFILRQRQVTTEVIYAAIVVYLLMAFLWAFAYAAVEALQEGSFSIGGNPREDVRLLFLYYSFVTLTTLGYGDITPLTDIASSLSILEAVIGQIYLVVLVAWLVGMHISQSPERKSE